MLTPSTPPRTGNFPLPEQGEVYVLFRALTFVILTGRSVLLCLGRLTAAGCLTVPSIAVKCLYLPCFIGILPRE